MARTSKIINTIENSTFTKKFTDVYAGKMTIKEVIHESGLPAWLIHDIYEQGLISETESINMAQLNIILTAIYCYNTPKFIKSAFRNFNRYKRSTILKRIDDSISVQWLKSRIETKIKKGNRVIKKLLLEEVFNFYPNLYNQEARNISKLSKIIINYKKTYRRKLSKLS